MMENEIEAEQSGEQAELAGFSERVVAFSLDSAIFLAGYHLTFQLAFPRFPYVIHPAVLAWPYLWVALFVLYQAFFACEGRASLGKRLLGLRVMRDGESLSLLQAVIRSVLYPLSSILCLGFAWSLFNKSRQCWHDLAVGSVVIRERPLRRLALVRACAGLCIAVLAGAWMWDRVWQPRYQRIMTVAYAHVGLSEMAQLQKNYRLIHGRYASSIFALSEVSVDPSGFLTGMGRLMEIESGVAIKTSPKGFVIAARARDDHRTIVRIQGS